jgi:hypothetical protein
MVRLIVEMNDDAILEMVMATRPGLDRQKAKSLVDALFEGEGRFSV